MLIVTGHKNRFEEPEGRESGFTLIELVVVIIVIGILAAIAMPVYAGVQSTANETATRSDLSNDAIAVTAYVADAGGSVPASVTDDAMGTVPASGAIAAVNLSRFGWSKSSPSTSSLVYVTSGSGTSARWCITGTSMTGTAYRTSSSTKVAKGTCAALGASNY